MKLIHELYNAVNALSRREHALPIKIAAGIVDALKTHERHMSILLDEMVMSCPWWWTKKRRKAELERRQGHISVTLQALAQTLEDSILRCINTEDDSDE